MTLPQSPRVVVFDMDETLGHFVQLGGFWDVLQSAHGRQLPPSHFVETMSLYPEVVRPGMEVLLSQLVLIITVNYGVQWW